MAVMLSSITWKLIELKKYQQIALFSKENQLLRGKEKSSHWVFGIKEFTRFFSLLKSYYPIATLRCLFWTSHLPKSVGLLNRLISRTFKQLSYLEPSPNSQWWSLLYFLLHLKPLPRILPHREENKRHFSSNRALSLRHRTTRLLRWSLRRRSLSLCGDARQQWRISALDGFSGQIDGQRCVLLRVRDPWFPALSLLNAKLVIWPTASICWAQNKMQTGTGCFLWACRLRTTRFISPCFRNFETNTACTPRSSRFSKWARHFRSSPRIPRIFASLSFAFWMVDQVKNRRKPADLDGYPVRNEDLQLESFPVCLVSRLAVRASSHLSLVSSLRSSQFHAEDRTGHRDFRNYFVSGEGHRHASALLRGVLLLFADSPDANRCEKAVGSDAVWEQLSVSLLDPHCGRCWVECDGFAAFGGAGERDELQAFGGASRWDLAVLDVSVFVGVCGERREGGRMSMVLIGRSIWKDSCRKRAKLLRCIRLRSWKKDRN